MAIETDFTVYPNSKVIRHTSSNDDVHEMSVFYSWLQNLFDEPGYMSYQKPIKYNTPTSYTMLNGWFLDNGDGSNILEYLTGGSIDTTGYETIDDPIYMMDVDNMVLTFITSDLDEDVRTDDTDTVGPLLSFKAEYPVANSARCWFRDVNGIGKPGAAEDVDIPTGQGDYTNTGGGAAESGDEIYANIYTIASWASSPNAQVYIKQKHPVTGLDVRVTEWSNTDSWDRGSAATDEIDILLPVKLGGNVIDNGTVVVYGRQTGDTFTHYDTNVGISGASRTPIAVETSSDVVNVTKGEHYLLYDGSDTGSFEAGDIIQSNSTDDITPPTFYAEVVDDATEFSGLATGILTLRGLRGTIADSDSLYVGTVDEGQAVGSPGGTYITWDASTVDPTTLDQTMTGAPSGTKRLLKGVDNTADVAVLAVDETVTGSSKDVYYLDFADDDTITGSSEGSVTNNEASISLISDYTDVVIAHINGTIVTSNGATADFEIGETIDFSIGGTAILVAATPSLTSPTAMTIANMTGVEPTAADAITGLSSGATADCDSVMTDVYKEGFEFPQQSEGAEYAVFIQGGDIYQAGRTLEDIYAYIQYKCRDGETDVFYTSDGSDITQEQGQFYIKAYTSYSTSKTAPFGTLAGGVFFGAQGVWIEGMDSGDDNSVSLTDHATDIQEPDTSINVTVTNTREHDRIVVYLEDGSTGLPLKTQYSIQGTPAVGDSEIPKTSGTPFPKDTPSTGWAYVVDNVAVEEHKYRFTSWTSETLTLAAKVTGTDEGTGSFTQIDDDASFAAAEIGDIILNTSDSGFSYITEVTNANSVQVTVNSDGFTWASAGFVMNGLVQGYTSSDTFYVPYLEDIEDAGTDISPGTSTKSLLYVANRAVGIRVRNVGGSQAIQPFNTTGDILITGMSQSVIRTDDEVYS